MPTKRTILKALITGAHDEIRRLLWWLVGVALLLVSVLFIIAGAIIAGAAVCGWQTVDWSSLGGMTWLIVLLATVSLMPLILPLVLPAGRRKNVRFIRTALAAGDDTVGPPAAEQPSPLAPEELPSSGTTLRSLRRVVPSRKGYALWALVLFTVPLEYTIIVPQLPDVLPQVAHWPIYAFLRFAIGLLLWVMPVLVYVRLASLASGRVRPEVTVDETGLTWQQSGRATRPATVSWQSIHSFFMTSYREAVEFPPPTMFVLDAGDAVLAWTVSANSPSAVHAESELLARLIVTRTGLPLRDLSPLLASLSPADSYTVQRYKFTAPPAILSEINQLNLRAMQSIVFVSNLVVFSMVGLSGLMINGPLSQADTRLENCQQTYFAGLVPRIHAETPLYYDALSHADIDWSAVKPTADNNQESGILVNGSYVLTGKAGSTVQYLTTPVYTDAAVEVTVRRIGESGQLGEDDVGLIVRANSNATNMVVFMISSIDGSWSLMHYVYNPTGWDGPWQGIASGTSDAIHRGDGVANQVLVLVRGQTFVLYINGHFIASAFAVDAHDLLQAGQAGVYLNDGALTASFNDFAIYPVKSPPSLDYV